MTRFAMFHAIVGCLLVSLHSAEAQTPQTRLVPADQKPALPFATSGPLVEAGQTAARRPGQVMSRTAPATLYYNGVQYRAVGGNGYRLRPQPASWTPGRAAVVSAGFANPRVTVMQSPTSGLNSRTPAAMPSGYYYGRGLVGQPKLYVPRQPLRNFFRYITP